MTLHEKYAPSVIHTLSGGSTAASNRAVEAHDGGHHAVDLLGGFFFVGFDVPGRAGADEDVVHHPSQNRVTIMSELSLQDQFHQFLGR